MLFTLISLIFVKTVRMERKYPVIIIGPAPLRN
jgi:hypothetical protein